MSKNKHHNEFASVKEERKPIFPPREEEGTEDILKEDLVKEEDGSAEDSQEVISTNDSSDDDIWQEEIAKRDKLISDLNAKVSSLQETLLRNTAELQNYKRRKDEETEKVLKYKNEDVFKEMLSIVDNFERAIKMDDDDLADEVSKFLEGFKLIYTNMIGILNRFDVHEISDEGVEFDPSIHHAVLTEHDENKPAGVVLEVLQKGYTYKDRVIRAAMVKVNE